MSGLNGAATMTNGQTPVAATAAAAAAGTFKDELDDFERFALENLVRNEWGLKVATLNRLMYCGVSVECLEVIEEHDLNDIFNDERAIGQKILLRHRLREWRKGLHWNSPEHPTPKRRFERHSIDPLEVEKKPRISTSNSFHESSSSTPNIILPDTRNPSGGSGIPSSSTSASSSITGAALSSSNHGSSSGNAITDAGSLPIQISPEALAGFLQGSRSGRWVLKFFAENHHLDKKALTELTHVVVEPFLVFNITFTHALMRHYAEVICQLFHSEQVETFYCPRNMIRKNPTGKLYDRYVNQRLRYKTKFNAQRPTFVPDTHLNRTFAEMSTVTLSSMMQQHHHQQQQQQQQAQHYMDYSDPRGYGRASPPPETFSEESMNIYGGDEGSILIDGN
ncbi:uncharacterized protein LOC109418988 [Aedes albopictus]|uniref:Uncharacterized protein n=1 Tax=Aedes albopictus TaxID=7160 RepID=A0ABM1Z6F1_AEDAL|nr:uncharacterized protein LOC109418988 [Aedes albopictus]